MTKAGLDKPRDSEIEISVFGRGFGECIVCHLGNGRWVVIDSLLTIDRTPIPLAYLKAIDVPLDNVRSIVLTHWHDDHIQGAALVVEACPQADVTLPITLCKDEFKQVLKQRGDLVTGKFTNGVEELLCVLELLSKAKHRRKWALANRILVEVEDARVDALSPSDEDVEKFLIAIHDWANEPSAIEGRLSRSYRNDTSVAVVIKVGDELILLGSDLEVRGALSGWQGVHENAWGERGKAKVFKVAHHGSITGEYGPIWQDLLHPDPISVLAPYNRGHKLPTDEDITRICDKSGKAFSASRMVFRSGSRQNSSVERTLREANIVLRRMPLEVGHVRLRKAKDAGEWEVALFQSACPLQDMAA